MTDKHLKIKSLIQIVIVVALFILFSYFTQKNLETIKLFIGDGLFGAFLYVLIVVAAVVIAPISAMPLLPVASNLWGWFLAAILSIVGWAFGALIAFIIAREFGVPVVRKIFPLEKIYRFETLIPKQNLFWSIVFLRMVIPVDVLSYALGLFSQMSKWRYFLATLLGISPFAFVFAYVGRMPFYYQIIAWLSALLIFLAGWFIAVRHNQKNKSDGKITIRVYFWGGQKWGIKIKSICKECDISIPLIKNLIKKEFKDKPVRLEIKPWLDNVFEAFFKYGAWHAPIVAVNDELISQGEVVDVKMLWKTVEKEFRK